MHLVSSHIHLIKCCTVWDIQEVTTEHLHKLWVEILHSNTDVFSVLDCPN
jgi:hypothetical protein